jgi:hypothetical protein
LCVIVTHYTGRTYAHTHGARIVMLCTMCFIAVALV